MSTAPILSTPDSHILEHENQPKHLKTAERLSDEQLYLQYEIQRTVREIRGNGWKRIALQFPDEMLGDAPRVCGRLGVELRRERRNGKDTREESKLASKNGSVDGVVRAMGEVGVDGDTPGDERNAEDGDKVDVEEKLTILADTSYGACCVDEIAAEHVDADAVVHYGRTCLSPTARLPVIYVFTAKSLDLDAAVETFKATHSDKDEKVCLMADIPYSHHVESLALRLRAAGYENIYATEVKHDPASLLPNRSLPPDVSKENPDRLKDYSIFHISNPPTSLLLILTSRVRQIHIYPTASSTTPPQALQPATTLPLLRRRYALLTRIPSTPIIGILINTLSVRSYLTALAHLESLIASAGKKSYTFVVGKLNAAKLANFAEVGAWVVVGCWESSLVEGERDFLAPMLTPFELEVALMGDGERRWGGEWEGGFEGLVDGNKERNGEEVRVAEGGEGKEDGEVGAAGESNWADEPSDDEPPDFDLRTGRYVSNSRPVPRARPAPAASKSESITAAPPSSALVQRAKAGDLASVNGAVSPAAEYLRSKRTWQGLGSDYHEVEYERDDEGKIRGAPMEEGRSGVARGYAVGGEEVERT